jgi:fluoride ion exporter CrcB/FEX
MVVSVLSISVGASLGALPRWLLAGRFYPLFPALRPATLAANLIGGYLIGVAIAEMRIDLSENNSADGAWPFNCWFDSDCIVPATCFLPSFTPDQGVTR